MGMQAGSSADDEYPGCLPLFHPPSGRLNRSGRAERAQNLALPAATDTNARTSPGVGDGPAALSHALPRSTTLYHVALAQRKTWGDVGTASAPPPTSRRDNPQPGQIPDPQTALPPHP